MNWRYCNWSSRKTRKSAAYT